MRAARRAQGFWRGRSGREGLPSAGKPPAAAAAARARAAGTRRVVVGFWSLVMVRVWHTWRLSSEVGCRRRRVGPFLSQPVLDEGARCRRKRPWSDHEAGWGRAQAGCGGPAQAPGARRQGASCRRAPHRGRALPRRPRRVPELARAGLGCAQVIARVAAGTPWASAALTRAGPGARQARRAGRARADQPGACRRARRGRLVAWPEQFGPLAVPLRGLQGFKTRG